MRVAADVRFRNAYIWEAVQKCGSQQALAEYLGVNQGSITSWLNFQSCPPFDAATGDKVDFYTQIDIRFTTLIGVGLETIFPLDVRTHRASLKKMARQVAIREMPIEKLIEAGLAPVRLLNQSPDELAEKQELGKVIDDVLKDLKEREADIIRRRFGLNGDAPQTMEEVGMVYKITQERVRQIEAKALRLLRHPSKSRRLKPFTEGGYYENNNNDNNADDNNNGTAVKSSMDRGVPEVH